MDIFEYEFYTWLSIVTGLYILTYDYYLSYYAVPPPVSPTTKSAGTPSEAGSQDSDGAAGPR